MSKKYMIHYKNVKGNAASITVEAKKMHDAVMEFKKSKIGELVTVIEI